MLQTLCVAEVLIDWQLSGLGTPSVIILLSARMSSKPHAAGRLYVDVLIVGSA